jgi:hypothetical protein
MLPCIFCEQSRTHKVAQPGSTYRRLRTQYYVPDLQDVTAPKMPFRPRPRHPGPMPADAFLGTMDADASAAKVTGRSNWERLQPQIAKDSELGKNIDTGRVRGPKTPLHAEVRARKREALAKLQFMHDASRAAAAARAVSAEGVLNGRLVPKGPGADATRVVAMDCEMVGVGADGLKSALARVCVVRLPSFFLHTALVGGSAWHAGVLTAGALEVLLSMSQLCAEACSLRVQCREVRMRGTLIAGHVACISPSLGDSCAASTAALFVVAILHIHLVRIVLRLVNALLLKLPAHA